MRSILWLTARRVRAHALLLAVSLWTIYAVDMSAPGLRGRFGVIKGADFLHFYTLGTLVLQDRGDLLYDMRAQTTLLGKLVPQAAGYVYVPLYGPQVSLFFAPFARLSYGCALTAWLFLNAFIYTVCCSAIWKTCAHLQSEPWTVFLLAAAFPGFFQLLLWGQTSGLALLCFTLVYLALRAQRPFLAGLALGSLIFKPQLGLAAAVMFVFLGEWEIVGGSLVAASIQLAAGWLHFGSQVMRNYFYALTHVRDVLPLLEPRPYQTHSLRSFWTMLVPWPSAAWGLYFLSALAVLTLTISCWRSSAPLALRYSALLLASVLVAPHLTVYDLVILAPALLLLGDWALANFWQGYTSAILALLYFCYPVFLAGPLARFTHVQLSVPTLAALLWLIWRAAEGGEPAPWRASTGNQS